MWSTKYLRDLAGAVYNILFDIYAQSYPSKCKEPCTFHSYQAEHKSKDPRKGGSIFFIFDQTAISSETHLVIDGFNIVNRIGGIIGFCRNIFWFLLFLTGLSKTIEFIIKYFICLQQKNDMILKYKMLVGYDIKRQNYIQSMLLTFNLETFAYVYIMFSFIGLYHKFGNGNLIPTV